MTSTTGRNELIIIAGPNGSGKTTFAKEYLDTTEDEYVYLSADEIASEINPDDPASVRLQAGREFFNRFHDLIAKEKNLLIESTLSGKSMVNLLKRIQSKYDYLVTLIFIFLDNESLCIERVNNRVRKGGHPVPHEDIIRRFGRSIVNFWDTYRYFSDQWILYYNTEDSFQEVAHNTEDRIYVYDEPLFNLFKQIKTDYE